MTDAKTIEVGQTVVVTNYSRHKGRFAVRTRMVKSIWKNGVIVLDNNDKYKPNWSARTSGTSRGIRPLKDDETTESIAQKRKAAEDEAAAKKAAEAEAHTQAVAKWWNEVGYAIWYRRERNGLFYGKDVYRISYKNRNEDIMAIVRVSSKQIPAWDREDPERNKTEYYLEVTGFAGRSYDNGEECVSRFSTTSRADTIEEALYSLCN